MHNNETQYLGRDRGVDEKKTATNNSTNLLTFISLFMEGELALCDNLREFVNIAIELDIAGWSTHGVFPKEIVPQMAKFESLGMHLKGFECAGSSAVEYGIAAKELEAVDSGLGTFVRRVGRTRDEDHLHAGLEG